MVVKVNKELPINDQEPYPPLKVRGERIINAPSELDCIPTP